MKLKIFVCQAPALKYLVSGEWRADKREERGYNIWAKDQDSEIIYYSLSISPEQVTEGVQEQNLQWS